MEKLVQSGFLMKFLLQMSSQRFIVETNIANTSAFTQIKNYGATMENPVKITTLHQFHLTRKIVGTQFHSRSIVSGFKWSRLPDFPLRETSLFPHCLPGFQGKPDRIRVPKGKESGIQ